MSSLFCSEFYTADAASACLFLPAVDTLNPARLGTQQLEQMLASLPTWNEGENQLIFTFASSGNTFCEVHNYMFGVDRYTEHFICIAFCYFWIRVQICIMCLNPGQMQKIP